MKGVGELGYLLESSTSLTLAGLLTICWTSHVGSRDPLAVNGLDPLGSSEKAEDPPSGFLFVAGWCLV